MAPYMEKTVLPILKETKTLWQPSDFLPESSSETFLDEVSRINHSKPQSMGKQQTCPQPCFLGWDVTHSINEGNLY